MSDLESIEHSSSEGSIDDKLPSTNNLIRGKEGQYAVGKKIAQGRYGAVYEVLRKSDGKPFACKLEICDANSHGLDMDYTLMNLAVKRGCHHMLHMIDRGKIEEHFKFIVMPLLGNNVTKIQSLFVDGRLSLSTSLRLGLLALSAIQELHSIGYTHRDIKPSNFCLQTNNRNEEVKLILIDYGICRAHKHRSGELRTPRQDVRFRGTARYASISAHKMEEQSPKDDIESWFYMVIEFLTGFLPWSHLGRDEHNDLRLLKEHALNDGAAELFKYCPKVEFRRIQKHIAGLTYYNQPDYSFISQIMQLAMKNNNIKADEPYDWQEI